MSGGRVLRYKIFIAMGWILTALAINSIAQNGSDSMIIGQFILSVLSFLYAEIEEIKQKLNA